MGVKARFKRLVRLNLRVADEEEAQKEEEFFKV
jgi:hypothetical protein